MKESSCAYFRLYSVWEDDDLLELYVAASNGQFSGGAHLYTTHKELRCFADDLKGYPNAQKKECQFSTYSEDNLSYITLNFTSSSSGRVYLKCQICEVVDDNSLDHVKNYCDLIINVEPAAIDEFVMNLTKVPISPVSSVVATLKGCLKT